MTSLRAPRYLSRFRCLAERCPDTCCAGLVVELNDRDLHRLRTSVGATGEGTAELAAAVTSEDGGPVLQGGAGRCGFLQPDLRCSVIRRFGEGAVPDACALYPRELVQFPDRLEVWATLACPEAARLCLTAEDSLEVVEVGEEIASRRPTGAPPRAGTPAQARLDEGLRLGSGVLGDASLPLAARLARLTLFADKAEVESWGEATAWLTSASSAAESARWLAAREPQEEDLASARVFEMLDHLKAGASPRYLALLDTAWSSFTRGLAPESGERLLPALAQVRRERVRALPPALSAELDTLLSRYACNEWRRVWFTRSPSMLSHLFKLSLRLAAIRTLLLGQPALAADAGPNQERLEQCLVEVVQIFSRRFDSRSTLAESLDLELSPAALGLEGPARIRAFAAI